MSKKWKKRIIILGIIAVVIAALIITANIVITKLLSKDSIEKQLGNMLKCDVKIGNLQASILTGIHLTDLTITKKNNEKWVSADDFVLDFSLFPLLKKEIVVTKISLENPDIILYRDKKGIWDFAYLLKNKKSEGKSNLKLQVRDVYIKNANFKINDESNSLKTSLEGISISADGNFLTGTADFDIELAKLNGENVNLKSSGKAILFRKRIIFSALDFQKINLEQVNKIMTAYLKNVVLPIQINSGILSSNIKNIDISEKEIKGKGKIELKNYNIMDEKGFIWKGSNISADFDLNAKLENGNLKTADINNISIDYNNIKLAANGNFNIGNDSTVSYNINLQSDIDIDKALKNIPDRFKSLVPDYNVSGKTSVDINLKSDKDKLISNAKLNMNGVNFEGTESLPSLRNMKGTIRIKNNDVIELSKVNGIIDGINITDISGNIKNISDPIVALNINVGRFDVGTALKKMDKYKIPKPEGVNVSGIIKSWQINVIGKASGNLDYKGTAEAENLDLQLSALPFPVKNISGTIGFDKSDLKLSNLNLNIDKNRFTVNGNINDYAGDRIYLKDIKVTGENLDAASALDSVSKLAEISALKDYKIQGKIKMLGVNLSGTPDDIKYSGTAAPENLSIKTSKIKGVINNINGRIDFNKDDIKLSNLNININDQTVTLNGDIKKPSADKPEFDLKVNSGKADVSDLIKLAKDNGIDIPKDINVTGSINNADIKLNGNLDNLNYSGSIESDNITLIHPMIPGPVTNINGKINFDKNNIKLEDINGIWGISKIFASGRVLDYTAKPYFDITAKSSGINLDAVRKIISMTKSSMFPDGTYLAGEIKNLLVSVKGTIAKPDINGSLELKNTSVVLPDFPLKLKDADGQIKFDKNNIIVKGLNGNVNDASAKADINIRDYNTKPSFNITASAKGMKLDNITELLPKEYKKDINGLILKGVSDVNIAASGTASNPKYDINLKPSGVYMEYAPAFTGGLKNIIGSVKINTEKIDFNPIKFNYGKSSADLSGVIENYKSLKQLEKIKVAMNINSPNIWGEDIIKFLSKGNYLPEGLSFSGNSSADLKLNGIITEPDIDGKVELKGIKIEYPMLNRPLENVKGHIDFKKHSASSNNLQADLGSSRIFIDGKVDDIYKFKFKTNVKADNVKIAEMLDNLKFDKSVRDQLPVEGYFSTEANLRGSMTELLVDGTGSSKQISYHRAEFTNIRTGYSYDGSIARVYSLKCNVIGGKLDGQVEVDLKKKNPAYTASADISNANLGQLFELFGEKGTASSGDIYGKFEGKGIANNMNTIDGTGNLLINKVILKDIPTLDQAASALNAIIGIVSGLSKGLKGGGSKEIINILAGQLLKNAPNIASIFSNRNTTNFDKVSGDFKVREGYVSSDNVNAYNSELSIKGKLKIGFNESLDCRLGVYLSDTGVMKIEDVGMREYFRQEPIPLTVTGTVSNPNFHKDEVAHKIFDAYRRKEQYRQKAEEEAKAKEAEKAKDSAVEQNSTTTTTDDNANQPKEEPKKPTKEEIIYDILKGILKK